MQAYIDYYFILIILDARWWWWCMPLISDLCEFKTKVVLQSEFHDSQGYTKKPCLEKKFLTKSVNGDEFILIACHTGEPGQAGPEAFILG